MTQTVTYVTILLYRLLPLTISLTCEIDAFQFVKFWIEHIISCHHIIIISSYRHYNIVMSHESCCFDVNACVSVWRCCECVCVCVSLLWVCVCDVCWHLSRTTLSVDEPKCHDKSRIKTAYLQMPTNLQLTLKGFNNPDGFSCGFTFCRKQTDYPDLLLYSTRTYCFPFRWCTSAQKTRVIWLAAGGKTNRNW